MSVFFPHIPDWKEHEEVIVGLSSLQVCLATVNVFHEFGSIAPDAVRWTYVNGCIEFPSWPGIILWRIACAMEIDIIDTCAEHEVEVGFHLRE
jgi:hypothetical protein